MRSLLLSLLLIASASAASGDEVDQEFTGPGTDATVQIDEAFPRAQTFTVGTSGTLTRIAISLARGGSSLDTDQVTIDVRPTDENGVPLSDDGSALAAVTIPATQMTQLLDPENLLEIDLSIFAVAVASGERLAIVARSDVPFLGGRAFNWLARIVTGDGYPGGTAWYRPTTESWQVQPGPGDGVDLVFRTWVPEPGATLSAAVACGALALRIRLSSS